MCIGGGGGGGSPPPAATPVAPAPAPVTVSRLGRSASKRRKQARSGSRRKSSTRSGLTVAKTGIQYSGSGTGVNA